MECDVLSNFTHFLIELGLKLEFITQFLKFLRGFYTSKHIFVDLFKIVLHILTHPVSVSTQVYRNLNDILHSILLPYAIFQYISLHMLFGLNLPDSLGKWRIVWTKEMKEKKQNVCLVSKVCSISKELATKGGKEKKQEREPESINLYHVL